MKKLLLELLKKVGLIAMQWLFESLPNWLEKLKRKPKEKPLPEQKPVPDGTSNLTPQLKSAAIKRKPKKGAWKKGLPRNRYKGGRIPDHAYSFIYKGYKAVTS